MNFFKSSKDKEKEKDKFTFAGSSKADDKSNNGAMFKFEDRSESKPSTSPKRDDLVSGFDAMALSGQPSPTPNRSPKPVPHKEDGFVGGFSPNMNVYGSADGWVPSAFRRQTLDNYPNNNNQPPSWASPSPAPAIPMPIPGQQSLTMQHALNTITSTPPRPGPSGLMPPNQNPWAQIYPSPHTPPSRPQSEGVLPPPSYPSGPNSKPPSSPAPIDVKVTPTRARPRASSVPPSPSTPTTPSKSGNTVQCSGFTKAGKRCTRQIKAATSALANTHPDAQIERFCHQHAKELLDVSGFYSHKVNDEYVKFEGIY